VSPRVAVRPSAATWTAGFLSSEPSSYTCRFSGQLHCVTTSASTSPGRAALP